MKKKLLTAAMLLSALVLVAQDAAMIAGNINSSPKFSYTVGQIAYQKSFENETVAKQSTEQSDYEYFDFAIGDESLKSDLNLAIYPNPTHDLLNIEVKNNDQDALLYQIIKNTGEIQSTGKLTLETTTISTKNLVVGTYFIKIIHDERTIKVLGIIKK